MSAFQVFFITFGVIASPILAQWLIRNFLCITRILGRYSGPSMEPTLPENIEYFVLPTRRPRRYDVVNFWQYEAHGLRKRLRRRRKSRKETPSRDSLLVKRIIALPGETVQIKSGRVYIGGERLTTDPFGDIRIHHPGIAAKPLTLGEDEYFCLGDNRNNSRDCRVFGPVKRSQLHSRALVPKAKLKMSALQKVWYKALGIKSDERIRAAILARVKAARKAERAKARAEKEAHHGH